MSVLIKGMEMPKNCGECQFCHTENFTIYCCPTGREDILYDAIPEWCPLVQMPHITDEQISDAFLVAIASYWEEKSKHLTQPPVPCCVDTRKRGEDVPHGEWIIRKNRQGKHIYSVCSRCNVAHLDTDFPNFCENCGSDNRHRILDEAVDGEGKDGNVKEGGAK